MSDAELWLARVLLGIAVIGMIVTSCVDQQEPEKQQAHYIVDPETNHGECRQ